MRIVTLTLLAILLPAAAEAGAWLMPEGKTKLIVPLRFYYAGKAFDDQGNLVNIDTFAKAEISPFVEYGLMEDVTIGGQLETSAIYNLNANGTANVDASINRLNIFARVPFYEEGGFMVSGEVGATQPFDTSAEYNPQGNSIIPNAKLNLGYSAEDFFVDSSAAYYFRGDKKLDDMVKLELSVGYNINDRTRWLNQIFHDNSTGTLVNNMANYDLTTIQTSIVLPYNEKYSDQFGISFDVQGKSTTRGVAFIYSHTSVF